MSAFRWRNISAAETKLTKEHDADRSKTGWEQSFHGSVDICEAQATKACSLSFTVHVFECELGCNRNQLGEKGATALRTKPTTACGPNWFTNTPATTPKYSPVPPTLAITDSSEALLGTSKRCHNFRGVQ